MKSVLFGTAQTNGPIPSIENCYDPSSLSHVLSGTYPTEADMQREMLAVMAVFQKYEVEVFRPSTIENCNQIFARDIAFVIDDKFIKSNILPDRAKEYHALEALLQKINPDDIIELPEACHVEGGDVILCNDYIFIGIYSGTDYARLYYCSEPTYQAAGKAIQNCFPHKKVKPFELRKSISNPLENALHLDCCFQPLGQRKALIHDQGFLSETDYQWLLDFFGKDNVFEVTSKEMSQMNCNVFSILKRVYLRTKFYPLKYLA